MRVFLCTLLALVPFVVGDFPSGLLSGVAVAQETAVPDGGEAYKPAKPLSIVFILDCSYSMSATFERGAGIPAIPRLDAARGALETVLNELSDAKAGAPEVGVWLFGHRVAWMPQGQGRLIRNAGAANGPIPAGLAPAEDVENILSLGIFGPAEFGSASERLRLVKPFGQTPVNLAILQSLNEFGAGGDGAKRIVIIADGANDQWHNMAVGFKPIKPVKVQDIVDSWKKVNLPLAISICYLGDPPDVREYATLANATGGQLLQPKTDAELLKGLRKLSRGE